MKKIITMFIASVFAFSCSQGVVDKDKAKEQAPAATEQTADPHAGQAAADPHAGAEKPKERKVNVPKEVAEKYKSLILEVKNTKDNSTVQSDVIIGQKAEVQGTPFAVEVEYYMPDFVIESDGTITTRSADEKNPVAKIKVYKMNEVFFDGWLFKNHPTEHGNFNDPNYSITIISSK
ncbi:hypothetical protein [Seleniivibrio woodruffii]|uniref:DUF2155 domain-containing protein n=1 Tax=Seleniivibrio woodruffii TaxID=1078050 RepID=A0A4R1KD73_9BACT|nr:hypothetical protein [Seleniivibrio woodruffii]TCK62484.1 hypothetical protein C8D98_1013 [Seleniivibrio woodruffii]TVZ37089.1 hypothetical protein OF66_2735 [Seleniivibrio woodruffii]